jgi:TP901 family phage tail tape measure protein
MSNLGTITYTIDVRTGNLVSSTRDADRSLNDVRDSMDRTDQSSRQLGGGLSKLAGAIAGVLSVTALINEFRKAINVTMEFNATISNLSALTGAVGKDLEVFRQAAIDIGGATSLSATQAAEAMKLIGSASPDLLKSADSLKEVTQQAVTLAEAAGSTMPEAADAITGALNQFQLGADQAARVINVLAAGAKEGASEINDTVAAMKNAGVVAAQAGLNFEQFNGAIQALAQGQIKGAEAGTGLRNVLTILNTQMKAELRPSVVGLSTALANLEKAGMNDTQMVKLFGRENITVAKVMLQFRGTMDDVTGAITGTSEAYKQAKTNQDNLKGDVAQLSSAFETLQLAIGDISDDNLRAITKHVTEMLNGFTENKDTITNFFDNAATAGMAFAAVIAGRVVMSIGSYTYAQTMAVKATLENIAANQAAVGATLRRATVEKEAAFAALAVARAEFEAAKNTLAHALAADALSAAQTVATQKAAAFAAAQNAANAAATRGTIAINGLKGAMAFLGGPAGVILLAAAAIYYFASGAKTAKVEVDALTGSLDNLTFSQLQRTTGEVKDKIADLNVELAKARSNANSKFKAVWETDEGFKQRMNDNQTAVDDTSAALEQAKKRLEELADAQKKLSTPKAQAPDKDPEKKAAIVSDTSEEGQKALAAMKDQLALSKLVGEAKARLQAIQRLGATATDKEREEAANLGAEIYKLEEAKKTLGVTNKKQKTEAEQLAKRNAEAEKKGIESNIEAFQKLGLELSNVGKSARDLAMDQAELSLNKYATPEQVEQVRAMASALYDLNQVQANKTLLGQVDPSAGAQQELEKRLKDIETLKNAELLGKTEAIALKEQAELEYNARMTEIEMQRFAAQSAGNEAMIAGFDALASSGTQALSGLLSGTSSLQDAMGGIANTVLNAVIGSFTQAGVEWVKQQIFMQSATQATKAAEIGGIAAVTAAQTAATGTIAATTTATAATTGATVATSMAPAAGLSSIASFGGAAVIGGAALLATMALAKSAGGRQYGGGVQAGSMYRVNETGAPEIFNAANGRQYMMPNSRGEVVSNKDATAGNGGGGGVIVNIQNYSGAQVSQSQSTVDRQQVIDIVIGDMMQDGKIARATNQITGTRRQGV